MIHTPYDLATDQGVMLNVERKKKHASCLYCNMRVFQEEG